ncbi:TetR family transcriptional regulator, partial [cyanobacterium TDX16]
MAEGSKQRIQTVALDLLSRHGYAGTGIKAVSEASGLPYGSIYHHFPGGKEELVVSAL